MASSPGAPVTCAACGEPLGPADEVCSTCGVERPAPKAAVAPHPPAASEVLEGKWRLEKKLGKGGMGTVFLARDLELDRPVAIKMLAESLCDDEALVQRFEKEARLMARLEHPNLVPIYAVGRREKVPFIVMKFLEGHTLSAHLRGGRRLELREILSVTRQVCMGLKFIHERNVVHRDVKPANIVLAPDGHATLLDLGVARDATSSLTRSGALVGTPRYMSPEQILGRRVDHRADLYAVATLAYEMATGQPVFEGDSDFSVMKMHIDEQPRAPLELAEVPPALSSALLKGLAKDPAQRFQSAMELIEALEAAALPLLGKHEVSGLRPALVPLPAPRPAPGPATPRPSQGGKRTPASRSGAKERSTPAPGKPPTVDRPRPEAPVAAREITATEPVPVVPEPAAAPTATELAPVQRSPMGLYAVLAVSVVALIIGVVVLFSIDSGGSPAAASDAPAKPAPKPATDTPSGATATPKPGRDTGATATPKPGSDTPSGATATSDTSSGATATPKPGTDTPSGATATPKPGTDTPSGATATATPKPGTDTPSGATATTPKPGTDTTSGATATLKPASDAPSGATAATPSGATATPKPGSDTPSGAIVTPKPGSDTSSRATATATPKPGSDTPSGATATPKPGTDAPSGATATPKPATATPKPADPVKPAATRAPVAAAKTGPAEVRCAVTAGGELSWAYVDVDGMRQGATPLTLKLDAGKHVLVFRREGFAVQTRELNVTAGEAKKLVVELTP